MNCGRAGEHHEKVAVKGMFSMLIQVLVLSISRRIRLRVSGS
nr:MAG TPA: hypothetical protein [Caudoviricetes sp.]